MALLLDRRGDDIKITEVVVKVCLRHMFLGSRLFASVTVSITCMFRCQV
jgi:hypothetical protein